MAKKKFIAETHGVAGHFYAASIAEWRTGSDPEKLIKAMKAGGYPFFLLWVPLPEDASYEIDSFVPVVEGCIKLVEYRVEGK